MELKEESRGIVYIATGDKYFNEAQNSAKSVKATNPNLAITIITDKRRDSMFFDQLILINKPYFTMADKCTNLFRSPYSHTLYLDSDTYVTDSLDEIFELLTRFDFAGAHEVARGGWYNNNNTCNLPPSFAEINGGVLLYKSNQTVKRFLEQWVSLFWETQQWLSGSDNSWVVNNDQVSLRIALWQNKDLQMTVLATEYNALRNWGTFLFQKAKIVHGRGNIEKIAEQMNQTLQVERVYLQQFGTWSKVEHMNRKILIKNLVRFPAALMLGLFRRGKSKV